MRPFPNRFIEPYRVALPPELDFEETTGTNMGMFLFPLKRTCLSKGKLVHERLKVICGIGGGWEHVSVSLPKRTPTWAEMCAVKEWFWLPDECVIQYHPPAANYVNHHAHCLHLWRPLDVDVPMPPLEFV